MRLGFVLKETNEPIYIYDTETQEGQFTNDSTSNFMKETGIEVSVPIEGNRIQRKAAKLTDPDFHQLFVTYTKEQYDESKFGWKLLKNDQ